jgi:hypothetical protein
MIVPVNKFYKFVTCYKGNIGSVKHWMSHQVEGYSLNKELLVLIIRIYDGYSCSQLKLWSLYDIFKVFCIVTTFTQTCQAIILT